MPKKKEIKQPVVGEAVTEPLSAKEIEERAIEAKKDAPEEKPKKSLLRKSEPKETKQEDPLEAQITEHATRDMQKEVTQLLAAVQVTAKEHSELAAKNGFKSLSNDFNSLGKVAAAIEKRLQKEKHLQKRIK